jgi:hypothetical protein
MLQVVTDMTKPSKMSHLSNFQRPVGSGEAKGGGGGVWRGVEPPLASRITSGIGFIQNCREIFWEGVRGTPLSCFSLLEIVSLTRSKEVSSKSSTNTIDSELFCSFSGASCLFVSSVFGRKALKINRVWNFIKVYRHKCRRQCVDFCLKNALKLTCVRL